MSSKSSHTEASLQVSTSPEAPLGSSASAPPQKGRAADRIRAVAFDRFYQEGIRAIGIEEIVQGAGATKPSLYRSFASKDELAATYLRDYDVLFCQNFDAAIAQFPGDPRQQILCYLDGLSQRASRDSYRGCGLSNAIVEYPDSEHPAHRVAVESKERLRQRLREMSASMGAASPDELGDGLLLLIEGAYLSGQIFGVGGPVISLPRIAAALIDASLKS